MYQNIPYHIPEDNDYFIDWLMTWENLEKCSNCPRPYPKELAYSRNYGHLSYLRTKIIKLCSA
jgi:hypothetical protein